MALIQVTSGANLPTYINPSSGWIFSELFFTSTAVATGDYAIFFNGQFLGRRIADWLIAVDQLDTNASPTLTFSAGWMNGTALDTATYSTWVSGSTAAQSAFGQLVRPANAYHLASIASDNNINGYGRNRTIGMVINTPAATWAGNVKRMVMGIHLADI